MAEHNLPNNCNMKIKMEKLNSAVRAGNLSRAIKQLIDSYGLKDAYDAYANGFSLLHTAVKNNEVKIAKLLIEKGADVNAKDKRGAVPMFYAVKNSDFVMAELLLSRGAVLKKRSVLLRMATKKLSKEVVAVLLEYKANIEAVDEYGRTALHITATNDFDLVEWDELLAKKAQIAGLLLSKGANVNAKTKRNETPLHLACRNNNPHLVELLLKFKPDLECFSKGRTPLLESTGSESIIGMLIRSGANVNAKDEVSGESALHFAVKRGHIKVIRALLAENANINARDNEERTLLHVASSHDDPETVDFILNHGVNVDDKDINGCTALHFAAAEGIRVITEQLLEVGADVNILGKNKSLARRLAGTKYFTNEEEEDDFDKNDNIPVPKIIQKRLIMMSVAGLYLNEENQHFVSSDGYKMDFYRGECETEIKEMKNMFIENTKVTFYDLLTKRISLVAKYAKNELIFTSMSNYPPWEFKIYRNDLRRKFKNAIERKLLVDQIETCLEKFFGLSYSITDNLFEYLTNDDLKRFIEAFTKCSS